MLPFEVRNIHKMRCLAHKNPTKKLKDFDKTKPNRNKQIPATKKRNFITLNSIGDRLNVIENSTLPLNIETKRKKNRRYYMQVTRVTFDAIVDKMLDSNRLGRTRRTNGNVCNRLVRRQLAHKTSAAQH